MEKLNQSILLELADHMVKKEFQSPTRMNSNGDITYNEDAQDYFSEMYDHYLSIIEDVIK